MTITTSSAPSSPGCRGSLFIPLYKSFLRSGHSKGDARSTGYLDGSITSTESTAAATAATTTATTINTLLYLHPKRRRSARTKLLGPVLTRNLFHDDRIGRNEFDFFLNKIS